jgi:hypothetical protein
MFGIDNHDFDIEIFVYSDFEDNLDSGLWLETAEVVCIDGL